MHAANVIGNILGNQFMVEEFEGIPSHDYLRIRVCVRLEEPLMPGFFIACENNKIMWVQFRYEELFKYCVRCGCINHKVTRCTVSRQRVIESIQSVLGGVCERGFMVVQSPNVYTMFNLDLRALPNTSRHITSRVRLGEHPGVRPRADYFVDRVVDIDIGTTGGGRLYPGMAFDLHDHPFASPILFPTYHNFNDMHARVNAQHNYGDMEVDAEGGIGGAEGPNAGGQVLNPRVQEAEMEEGQNFQGGEGNVFMVQDHLIAEVPNEFVGEGVNNINIPEEPPLLDPDPYLALLQREGKVFVDDHDRNFQNLMDRRLRYDDYNAQVEDEQRGYYQVFNVVAVLPQENMGNLNGGADIVGAGIGEVNPVPVPGVEEEEEWPLWDQIPILQQQVQNVVQVPQNVIGEVQAGGDDAADFYSQGSSYDWPEISRSSSPSSEFGTDRRDVSNIPASDANLTGFYTPVVNFEEDLAEVHVNQVVSMDGDVAVQVPIPSNGGGSANGLDVGDNWPLLSAHTLKDYEHNKDTMSDSGVLNITINRQDKWRRICGMQRFKKLRGDNENLRMERKSGSKRKAASEPLMSGAAREDEEEGAVSSGWDLFGASKRQCCTFGGADQGRMAFEVEFEDDARLYRAAMVRGDEGTSAEHEVAMQGGLRFGFSGIEPDQFSPHA